LGERLCLSIVEVLVSKPFQQYYRKIKKGRAMHLDEGLFADSMEAMRVDTAGVTTHFPLLGVSPAKELGEPLSPK
jgi:hypothetical protein